jgi:hypothetical protein
VLLAGIYPDSTPARAIVCVDGACKHEKKDGKEKNQERERDENIFSVHLRFPENPINKFKLAQG